MTRADAVRLLFWCALGNAAVLSVWFAALLLARDAVYGLHARWFRIERERWDAIHYTLLAAYKLLIVFFNIVPLLVLWLTA